MARIADRSRQRTFTSTRADDDPPVPNPLEGVEFTLDGQVYTCEGKIDLLDVSELSMLAVQNTEVRSPQGLAMISQFLRMAFGPTEYMRLKAHIREYDTSPEVLFQIVQELNLAIEAYTEELTDRPTGPRSSSSGGPAARAEEISRVVSLGTGDVTFTNPDGTAVQDPAQEQNGHGPADAPTG